MKQCFSNATVMWDEPEIARRESLVREIPLQLLDAWQSWNQAVRMRRVETPILTPEGKLKSHVETGFNLVPAGRMGFLRPETTAGTFEAFDLLYPDPNARQKRMPLCLWQVGLSFRDEKNADTMRASKLRLNQFYQMEFQLFCSHGTKADYLAAAANRLIELYGGRVEIPESLPHYSERTIDWMIGDLEVAGCSVRKDWEHGMVFEVAIGIDRLVAITMQKAV